MHSTGSSPHTRGARGDQVPGRVGPRIIPAYAGSTHGALALGVEMGDHPRIRGEHEGDGKDLARTQGSSPHTRGAPPRAPGGGRRRGIIPAYAGSTRLEGLGASTGWDHPRIRGEHRRRRRSPPCRIRIIPAYAGSTRRPAWSTGGGTDHPRIRGEHPSGPSLHGGPTGSSPHTRGAPRSSSRWSIRRGIIPAYAGSTISCSRFVPAIMGSSPHTRGALVAEDDPSFARRIIPAYAGSTHPLLQCAMDCWDHPRIRGEHRPEPIFRRKDGGSSPHTRGAPAPGFSIRPGAGIIPAYAGSTEFALR